MAKKKVFSIGTALAQGLEETIESAQNYSGELRVDIIPIKKIETDPDNPRDLALNFNDLYHGIDPTDNNYERKSAELAALQSIAHSIKTQGIINPVTVYKEGEKYRLIAGERRTLASIVAGKSDIQAKILDSKPDPLRISLLQWIENIERNDLTLWERLKNLETIVEAYAKQKSLSPAQVTVTELSTLIGCVKSHAVNYKAVLHANAELKRLIFENKIKNLEKAALIADLTSHEVRQQAIDACLQGATLKKLKIIAEQGSVKRQVLRPVETRGRQTQVINFGITKNASVAKLIHDAIVNHQALAHVAPQFKNIDWSNHRSVTESFKQLLKQLEELHA